MWSSSSKIRRDQPLNVAFDGNSLFAAFSVDAAHTPAAQAQPFLAAKFPALTVNNSCPIAGQTWANMTSTASDIDATWIDGANNVLVIWETTNSCTFGARTGAQAASDAQAYMAGRLAVHPGWKIIGLSTIPRQGVGGSPAVNAQLNIADAIMKANFRAWGGRTWIDVRGAGSPFALLDYSDASFALNDDLWADPAGSRLHCTAKGYSIPAGEIVTAVLNLASQ